MPTTSKGLRYPAGSDSPNIAQYFQNLATDVNTALGGGAWSTYTPVWSTLGASTQPTIGNGTLAGRYRKLDDYTGLLMIVLQLGTTTSGGNGTSSNGYQFTLPSGWTNTIIPSALSGWFVTSGAPADAGGLSALIPAGATKITDIRANQNDAAFANGLLTATGNYLSISGLVGLA